MAHPRVEYFLAYKSLSLFLVLNVAVLDGGDFVVVVLFLVPEVAVPRHVPGLLHFRGMIMQ